MPEEPIVTEETTLLRLLADIVAAYVAHSPTPVAALPEMIRSVYVALRDVGTTEQADGSIEPAVPIKKSVFPDYIICLEDGKKLKMLKRHLRASYDMTPDEYRSKWGLPFTYPMVAPNYAAHRSSLAKERGLGRRPIEEPVVDVPIQRIPESVSGRKPRSTKPK